MTSCFIPRLLVVFTRQLEILVTTLKDGYNGVVNKVHNVTTQVTKQVARLATKLFWDGHLAKIFL